MRTSGRVLVVFLVVLTVLAGITWLTYPAVGRVAYSSAMAVESRAAGLDTHRVQVGQFRMAYYEGGPTKAPTIVMLHGFSADRDVWIRFAGHFTNRYHVLIPDLAGHGDTPFIDDADYSASAQADRLAIFLDDLGIERAHVIGNSMGGFVAARFAYQCPQRTLSLGLSDASGVTEPHPSRMLTMLKHGENPFLLDRPDQFDRFYPLTMAKPPYVPGFVKDAMAQDYVEREPELAEIFEDFAGVGNLDTHLGQLDVPAYVMWGEEDQLVDPSAARVWADGLPDAELVEYPGAGHMPMLEIPDRSARDYERFLNHLTN